MNWIVVLLTTNLVGIALFVILFAIYKTKDHKFTQQLKQFQTLKEQQKEILSSLSHDLRTPLNAIMGYTSLMLNKVHGELSEKQLNDLERISLNSDKILKIIDDFYEKYYNR